MMMSTMGNRLWLALAAGAGLLWLGWAQSTNPSQDEQLQRYRNLGKAFYENPTTQAQAVEEFRKALALRPNDAGERLNYGLALLRAGKTKEGIAELEKVQKQKPDLPHTWFNLGIEFKKLGEHERALAQFEQMAKLVPDEPITRYNLGVLYKLLGRPDDAIRSFELATKLDANLAAPHFQLYNAYRQARRMEDAQRELRTFQEIKKRTEGTATPEDMEWSAWAEIYDPVDAAWAADEKPAELKFESRLLAGKADARTARAETFELDGDGRADLLVWSAAGVAVYRGGAGPAMEVGPVKDVASVAVGDFNNDGFVDFAVAAKSGVTLWANEKGKFRAVQAALPSKAFNKVLWLDYDHDYDLDLVLLGETQALYRNAGAAGFEDRTADFPFQAGTAVDGVVFRYVADTKSADLLVSYEGKPGVLYRDLLQGFYRAEAAPLLPAGARQVTAVDFNNDRELDIAYLAGGQARLLRNQIGKFEAAALALPGAGFAFADLGLRGVQDAVAGAVVARNLGGGKFSEAKQYFGDPVAWTAGDFDGDAKIDLAAVHADGAVRVERNATVTANTWTRVRIVGVKNLLTAPLAEVEVKAGRLYQKKLYTGLPLVFGLRGAKQIDTVRITWPNGLIQNEPNQVAGKVLEYKEAQRLSGSCPIIWTWNGKEFEYITDVLGVAPLGASAGDGKYFPVDHDEYIAIKGEQLRTVKSRYEVRITEELSEAAYIDQIRLVAVDHPAEVDVFHNDKWKGPPFPEFRLYGVKKRVAPIAARDDRGRDVLREVLAKDKTYPDDFERSVSAVAEMHALELDFGKHAAKDGKAVMVLSGWVDWADGSTFLAVAQEKRGGLVPPYLQVKDARGEWKTVIEDMGMPAGKPKTIAVDLSGKWLSESREVRIVTNLCVYWDEIFLSEETSKPAVQLTDLAAANAEIRFRGYSGNLVHPERKQPEQFFYAQRMPVSLWNPTPGMYTRYGAVEELLTDVDDRFVIMSSGDEIRLLFDVAQLPPLRAGWKRDFLLKVDGWAKDRDANTAYSQTVEPLPFHGMTQYPYGANEKFPETPEHARWRSTYNTRPALRLIRPLIGDRATPPRKPAGGMSMGM
ncbi:MAG: FG-GAP-like repeat-containing protein [Bryobacteraceae bacterium]|nr:FG-GAP-like repeat-containing protein [Bryobacteraceae bacterium]